jgi:MFS family permease
MKAWKQHKTCLKGLSKEIRVEKIPTTVEPKKTSFAKTYLERIAAFSPNARKYLIGIIIYGSAMGVYQLLFNFYVLSLGYNEAVLGNLVTARSATSLIVALPMGYLANRIGHKRAFILGHSGIGIAILIMVLYPSVPIFVVMSIVIGLAQSLTAITMGPFLMENSGETERTYLFSFSSGLSMTASSIGQWIGGYLPTWAGVRLAVSATSATAYAWALGVIVIGVAVSLIPIFMISQNRAKDSSLAAFAPINYMRKNPGKLSKLILPILFTSIGAGMIMPFMNVFFRNVHNLSDASIGVLFAWGSLAMGIGLLLAPALAEKFGKIQVVVATQGLSIPFLALLGFAPWFGVAAVAYYLRLVLMNMSTPVYTTFTMEQVEPESRAMVASLSSMASNFGWAFSPTFSGYFQVNYGFAPPFIITIVFYIASVAMYYFWFWKGRSLPSAAPISLEVNPQPADCPDKVLDV